MMFLLLHGASSLTAASSICTPSFPAGPSEPTSPCGPCGPTGPRGPVSPLSPLSPLAPSLPSNLPLAASFRKLSATLFASALFFSALSAACKTCVASDSLGLNGSVPPTGPRVITLYPCVFVMRCTPLATPQYTIVPVPSLAVASAGTSIRPFSGKRISRGSPFGGLNVAVTASPLHVSSRVTCSCSIP